jgi:cytochrome c oxidase subunit 2
MKYPGGGIAVLSVLLVLMQGCSSSRVAEAIPAELDRSMTPVRTIAMTAERFHFTPDTVHVQSGTLLRVTLKSLDGTHGFSLSDFGIDETVKEGETKTLEFVARGKGEHPFHCSHFCGLGHFWMGGTVIVD